MGLTTAASPCNLLTLLPENVTFPTGEDSGSNDSDLEEIEDEEQYYTDSASEREGTEEQEEQHGDHVDTTIFYNPFGNEWTAAWHNNWYVKDEHSLTTDEVYNNVVTKFWMDALSRVNRNAISLLVEYRTGSCRVPLFKDRNGWEYQIGLSIGHMDLPSIYCPNVSGSPPLAVPLFELKARTQVPEAKATEQAPNIPKFAVQLGRLSIRNDARYPQSFTVPTTLTERTDYKVIVDVDSEDMPLWILAPRSQQQLRLSGPYTTWPNPTRPLPIFNGLLENDDIGYDCACILPPVRRLGTRPPDPDAPSFDKACELIRNTRATIDPAGLRFPRDKVKEFNGGVPLQSSSLRSYSDLPADAPTSASGTHE